MKKSSDPSSPSLFRKFKSSLISNKLRFKFSESLGSNGSDDFLVKKVVILGGGFAGIRCALDLAGCRNFEVVLVDKNNYHLFPADLYEVATAFNEKIEGSCLMRLKETIATPMKKILRNKRIEFICDEVEVILPEKKKVALKKHGSLSYDYLVVALGSEVNDYGIKGVSEYSFPFKKLKDGLRINCAMDQFFFDLHQRGEVRDVNFVVCGGGATGTETAAELRTALFKLCSKYNFPYEKVSVRLVEGGMTLGGFKAEGSSIALKRLQNLGVVLSLGFVIEELLVDRVIVKNEQGGREEFLADLTIWTAGVKVNSVVSRDLGDKERRGAILTNQFLQSVQSPEIFAAGDNAFREFEDGRPYPWLAQVAIQQGALVSANLKALARGEEMKVFDFKGWHFVLPVGGKFGIWQMKKRVVAGMWVWIIRRMVFFRYALSILPFWQAVKKAWHSHKVFAEND